MPPIFRSDLPAAISTTARLQTSFILSTAPSCCPRGDPLRYVYPAYFTSDKNKLLAKNKWSKNKILAINLKVVAVDLQDTNTPACLARSDHRPHWCSRQKSRTCRRQHQTIIWHSVVVIAAGRSLRNFDGIFGYKCHQKLREAKNEKLQNMRASAFIKRRLIVWQGLPMLQQQSSDHASTTTLTNNERRCNLPSK